MNSAWKLALLFAALSCVFQIQGRPLAASIAVAAVVFLFTGGAAVIVDLAKRRRRNAESSESPASSSTSVTFSGSYEVFLSFRGPDTRKGFADYLYTSLTEKGIRVFRDNEELPVGEEIKPSLTEAIKQSKIAIPIISKDYASSKSCLMELQQILECREKNEQMIIPIFYHVDISDVKHVTGSFRKSFNKLKNEGVGRKRIDAWKKALRDIGGMKGLNLAEMNDGHQGKFIQLVVSEVFQGLKKRDLLVTDYLVGIDHHVEEIMRKLDVDFRDGRAVKTIGDEGCIVGICGMPGVGKTTLAKFIYNRLYHLFDGCAYLENVRERYAQVEGLKTLRSNLVSQLINKGSLKFRTSDEAMHFIKHRFSHTKVLIFLDDVGDSEQLTQIAGDLTGYGPGSRIIVTSRRQDVLTKVKVAAQTYVVEEVEEGQALELFGKHAFGKDFVGEVDRTLSSAIVSATGRLPLALEAVGSCLFFKPKEVWEDELKKCKGAPHGVVEKVLQMCYEDLDENQKKIFLDIACFFIGKDERMANYMWEDPEYFHRRGIEALLVRSLVKVGENNELWMHDQLRDFGREIVRKENPEEPCWRSRLWIHKEALTTLNEKKGGSSSSISTLAKKESRVFLSFNGGPDIPDVFIGFLMAQLTRSGISVFGDGKKLPEGEDLVGVIKRSSVSIPIISKGYASSEGCLVELGVMLECRRTDGQTIIPIFYSVDPSDVRHVRGSFEMSLKDHEMKGTDGRTIHAWGRALREVGGLERFYSADNNSWSSFKLLKQLHLDVLQLFGKQDIKENLVGIQDRVQEVMTKLGVNYKDGQSIGLHGGDVRVVGIYGAGGIGKTTLAKAVYKDIGSLFDGCSYLEDIQERFTQSEGLKSLQNQLISDLLKRSCPMFTCEEGAHIIRHRFHSARVLIILDDVNHHHQLEPFIGKLSWFGPRSRIIVTTRDYGLVNVPEVAERYEVEPLKPDQALFLFWRHASDVLPFPEGCNSLFDEIISVTGRIPLAIEVLARLVCRTPTTLWQHTLKIMSNSVDPVERVLMASFEFLSYTTKEILLDIACFFVGEDIANPFSMWCACGYDPLSGIKVLLDMSLVQIGENNKLWMHDELRNLCQQFVCNGDPKRPERHSRLWNYEDAVSLFKERKGAKLVEALNLKFDNSRHDCFTCEEFELLPDLRFLKLGKARIIGDSKNALSNLRWLDWQGCPETPGACDLHLKELVILDLSWSKVAHDWKGWSQIKMPQLRILNLTGCTGLLMTPDLSGFEKLEILILEHCSRLVNIDASIAQLKCLVTLNLKFCTELSMLPKELNDMKEMRELLIDGTSIKEIPNALANMKKLKILSASNCFSLSGLPESIGQLEALSVLLLDSAKIVELPDSIGELVQLKQLSLRNCRCLGELPDSIGKLGSTLFELDVSGTGISKLPASTRDLRSLKVLKMDSCFIREFPHDIGRLTNLEEMHALRCRSLEGDIPSDIGELKSLRTLVLGYTRISSLPPCIQSLCCLQTLDLLHCDRIEALPILPSSLTHLHVISRNMKVVPFIDNLTKLEELCLGDEDFEEIKLPSTQRMMNSILTRVRVLSFLWPKMFPRLKVLELSHSRITDLCLRDECLPQLTKLVVSGANLRRILQLPLTLSFLSVRGCLSLKRLPTVQCLKGLTELQLSHSAVREVEGLGELGALEIIDISHCEIRNLEGLGQLTSLISLMLSDCDHLRELPNISNLRMLKILEIRRCREIKNIQGLQEIRSSLEKLHVGERKDGDSAEGVHDDFLCST